MPADSAFTGGFTRHLQLIVILREKHKTVVNLQKNILSDRAGHNVHDKKTKRNLVFCHETLCLLKSLCT